jgi:hypothetical protein
MPRKQQGKAKFIFNGSKDEFVDRTLSQIGLFNAEHKANFITKIKDGNLLIGLGPAIHGSGVWYEPTIVEKDNTIIIDGAINLVSWYDDNTKWWQNLISWVFLYIPLYILFSPLFLFQLIFPFLNNTPQKKLKIFMLKYMNCTEIKGRQKNERL